MAAVVPSDREAIVANANKAAQDLGYASLHETWTATGCGRYVVQMRCLSYRLRKDFVLCSTSVYIWPSVHWQSPVHRVGSISTDSLWHWRIIIRMSMHSRDNIACVLLHTVTFLRYRWSMLTSPDYFCIAQIVRLHQTSTCVRVLYQGWTATLSACLLYTCPMHMHTPGHPSAAQLMRPSIGWNASCTSGDCFNI